MTHKSVVVPVLKRSMSDVSGGIVKLFIHASTHYACLAFFSFHQLHQTVNHPAHKRHRQLLLSCVVSHMCRATVCPLRSHLRLPPPLKSKSRREERNMPHRRGISASAQVSSNHHLLNQYLIPTPLNPRLPLIPGIPTPLGLPVVAPGLKPPNLNSPGSGRYLGSLPTRAGG